MALPAIGRYGVRFLIDTTWDANRGKFGILPAIFGTLYSSILGLIIGSLFGLAIAVFLSEGFLSLALDSLIGFCGLSDSGFWTQVPGAIEELLRITIELLAAVPSVVYGLWGIFVIIPMIRPMADWFHNHLGWIPMLRA